MLKLRIWFVTVPLVLAMIVAAVVLSLWRNLSSEWGLETTAAEYVVNHTPIVRLESYQVFTGSGLEDVFTGLDSFGRQWIAFYFPTDGTAISVAASTVIPQRRVDAIMKRLKILPERSTLGYLTLPSASTISTDASVVYEVAGKRAGKWAFTYLDASSGRVLWSYQLQD